MEDCARMNCDKAAVALLTFSAQDAKAWLYDLVESNPAGGIMLCRRHANATVVPMSWQLVDVRDPAWPGPATDDATDATTVDEPPAPASTPPGAEQIDDETAAETAAMERRLAAALPSDAGYDREFAALDGALPVTPQPYREPREATLRAAGIVDLADDVDPDTDADMSLFELPLADVPAVTPHPDYR